MAKLPVLSCILAACILLCLPGPCRAQDTLPESLSAPSTPFLPYCQYLLDKDGTLEIGEVSSPELAQEYRPLVLKDLPRENGVLWLRFSLPQLRQDKRPGVFLLDMGQSLPGMPVLYEPVFNSLSGTREWSESTPAQRSILLLPEPRAERQTCYIRLDGQPGPWFAPMLRSPHDAATNLDSMAHAAALLALGVVMLLCLLRSLSEHGQWRIWTALFVAAALVQGLLGLPPTGSGQITLGSLPAVLAPGIALMLLPHVGRHLMRTPERSRALDIQLLLLSLPGAALALLPLVPGYAWLNRFLDLWPAATLLFVPTALGACLMGLSGSRRFLLGCLLPPLFVAGGILGLESDLPSSLLASAPLWGTALSALLIAATRAPRDAAGQEETPADAGIPDNLAPQAQAQDASVISLEHPLNDPALRLVPAPGVEPQPAAPLAAADSPAGERSSAFWEAALQTPLDDILRNGAALESCALAPAVRSHAEGMVSAARRLASIIHAPDKIRDSGNTPEPLSAFNLQYLMREVHDAVAPTAESAGIGLAWYMPPYLSHMYEGAVSSLGSALRLLLESAVRATRQGAVHFSVRPQPESDSPGHLLFTITDSGSGIPPQGRSMLALSRAWEMAGQYGGSLGVEYSPKGTTIAFTVRLRSLDQPETDSKAEQKALPLVLITGPTPEGRQTIQEMLAGQPCRCEEADTLAEALPKAVDFVPLLIVQGPEAVPASAPLLQQFEQRNTARKGQSGKVLAITSDDRQWKQLGDAGFTHALLEPVDAADLRQTVQDVLQALGAAGQAESQPRQAGRPPLPDLFGSSEAPASPMQMPDLTALPDLMRFTEDLREPAPVPHPPVQEEAVQREAVQEEAAPRGAVREETLQKDVSLGEAAQGKVVEEEVAEAAAAPAAIPEERASQEDVTLSAGMEEPLPNEEQPAKATNTADDEPVSDEPVSQEISPTAVAAPAAVQECTAETAAQEGAAEPEPVSVCEPLPEPEPIAAPEVLPEPLTTHSPEQTPTVQTEPAAEADSEPAPAELPEPAQQPKAAPAAIPTPADDAVAAFVERPGAIIVPIQPLRPEVSAPRGDDFVEWVGEPMPVGTPLSKPVASPVRPVGASKPAEPAPAQSGAGTVEAAGSGTRAYTSPSLKVPGE
ncbi:MAG: 7TM-DISM domain-containing protein, partial [Desulfovibrionaceae bacterium]|nr:7TM-DISM domain-containing protein [Desulfovibrionaceae bacterium]